MKIGFTTSFPVEVLFAAGHTPIDLNNIFISDNPLLKVQTAEAEGFPRNICSWIKGIYETVKHNEIKTIIGVVQGDCSNTHSLMSLLQDRNLEVIPFSFPYNKDRESLRSEIQKLREHFNVTEQQVSEVKRELDEIRKQLIELDHLTYHTGQVTGKENHLWLVSSSDFNGNPVDYQYQLTEFLNQVRERKPLPNPLRLGYIGVPPIMNNLYDFIQEERSDIVFNEVQRQFSMPYLREDITDQYLAFTYPYSVFERIEDISSEIKRRKIEGIISYSQAFCHRQIDNILLKKYLKVPFLAIEGDQPTKLDERTKLRLESFLDVIRFSRK